MQSHPRLIASWALIAGLFVCATQTNAATNAVGYAQYSDLSESLFLTSLFAESDQSDFNGRRLEFKFLGQQLSFRRFKRLMLQSSAINNPPAIMQKNATALESFVKQTQLKGSFQRGDHLVLRGDENGLTTIFNSVELGVIGSAELFDILLNSWVGKIPPSRELKAALLGQTNNQEIERAFKRLSYTDERREQILLAVNGKLDSEDVSLSESVSAVSNNQSTAPPKKVSTKTVGKVTVAKKSASTAAAVAKKAVTKAIQKKQTSKKIIAKEVVKRKPRDLGPKKIEIRQQLASLDEKPKSIFSKTDSEDVENIKKKYSRDLYIHASKNILYPRRSRQLKHTGKILAQVTIDRSGKLLDMALERESVHDALNRAVQKALKKSQPYPEVPELLDGESFTFEVPVTFSL